MAVRILVWVHWLEAWQVAESKQQHVASFLWLCQFIINKSISACMYVHVASCVHTQS